MFLLPLAWCVFAVNSIWIDQYNTIWDSPGVGQWQNLPIGNGDLTANVWLENENKPNGYAVSASLSVTPCINAAANQSWIYNATTKLLQNGMNCVVATGHSNPVETTECDLNNNNEGWTYNSNKEFVSSTFGTCLDIYGGAGPAIDEYKCVGSTNQQWTFDDNTKQIHSVRYPSKCLTAIEAAPSNYSLMFAFSKSDSYDLTSERLKVIQLSLKFDPPVNDATYFKEILYLSNGTVTIQDDQYFIQIYIDRNDNTLNVQSNNLNNKQYSVESSIISWRGKPNFSPGGETGESFCSHRNSSAVPLIPETMMNAGCPNDKNEVSQTIFYHRNNYQENGVSEWEFNLNLQSMGSLKSTIPDPYYNLTWGGVLYLTDSKRGLNASLSATDVSSSLLTFHILTKQTTSIDKWVNDVCSESNTYLNDIPVQKRMFLHNAEWNEFWNRSKVQITNENNATLLLVSTLYNEQRYLDALDGYGVNRSIKFNGQSFYIDAGHGPDYKQWASGYWWQNIRQPYYNTLVSGDNDMNIPMYNMFLNQIPLVKARDLLWFNHTNNTGWWYGETSMFTGLFQEGQFGYACGTNPNPLYNVIKWLRYHWVAGLELVNLLLDEYDWLLNDDIVTTYLLPISDGILNHFNNIFTEINSTTGKVIMYPSQSLETWQCPDTPPKASNCVLNPTEQIAGLKVVTKRLLGLPSKFGTDKQRQLWSRILNTFPDYNILTTSKEGTVIWPAQILPPSNTNSENTELYTVHPFRIYQWFKPNLSLAVNTYNHRRFPCNSGWCQDILDAAMLGLLDEASSYVIQRAENLQNGYNWKWSGYAGHFQDYEPSLDHLEWMRTAMHYMLINNNWETKQIYLFPTWPCEWSVVFKLHALNNTIVTLDYDGVNKKMNSISVQPSERMNDIKYVNCVSQ